MGSLKSALAIAVAVRRTRERLRTELDEEPAYADVWYMDDGQVFIRPDLADPFLRTLDEELARIGATRGSGPEVKSVARYVGRAAEPANWATDHVRRTCRVVSGATPVKVLGAMVGALRHPNGAKAPVAPAPTTARS